MQPHHSPALVIQSVTGPDCSMPIEVEPGRHLIGRAPTACIRIDDPAVELHHAAIDVDQVGVATLRQLSGRRPIVVTDPPGTPAHRSSRTTKPLPVPISRPLVPGSSISVGMSRLHVTEPAESRLGVVSVAAGDDPLAATCVGIDRTGQAAITWSPTPGTAIWIRGPRWASLAVVRSMVVQWAVAGRGSRSLAVDTSEPIDWRWIRQLPTSRRAGATADVPILVIDRSGPSHRINELASRHDAAVVAIDETIGGAVGAVLLLGSTGAARWSTDPMDRSFTMTGMGGHRAADIARRLRGPGLPARLRCGHAVGESPSNHRGPDPYADAASPVL